MILENDPQCAAYYANRSAAYMMVEEYNKALEDARNAFTMDSCFVKAYLRAAKCYIATGQTSSAMKTLQTAQDLEPKNKSIQDEVQPTWAIQTHSYPLGWANVEVSW